MLALLWPVAARGQTSVSGKISEDTTWTAANSPYRLTGDLEVANGVTLTIDPGVLVDAQARYVIEVSGSIVAKGTDSDPIYFTCIRYVPQCWVGLVVNPSGSVSLDHVDIAFAGAAVDGGKGKWTVTNSRMHHSGTGVRGGADELSHSLIDHNNTGVDVAAPLAVFEFNTITDNEVGVESEGRNDEIHNNNIYSNSQDNLSVCVFGGMNQVVNATDNWWGTTDEAKIAERICDQADNEEAPKVTFQPFAQAAIGGTPSKPPPGAARTFKFWLRRKLAVKGKLMTDPSSVGCIKKVTVYVQREGKKGWTNTKKLTTANDGSFRGRLIDRSGKYRAFAPEIEGVCAEAISRQRGYQR